MIKILITTIIFLSSTLIFAGDHPYSRYSHDYKPPENHSISRYSSDYKPQSSFNQSPRTGITNNSRYSSSTNYDDGSYRNTYRNSSNTRIKEYNNQTKQKRDGIKTTNNYGYSIKYNDGAYEKTTQIGFNSHRIIQKDNLGNIRYGIQNNNTRIFSDETAQRMYRYGLEFFKLYNSRIDETGKR